MLACLPAQPYSGKRLNPGGLNPTPSRRAAAPQVAKRLRANLIRRPSKPDPAPAMTLPQTTPNRPRRRTVVYVALAMELLKNQTHAQGHAAPADRGAGLSAMPTAPVQRAGSSLTGSIGLPWRRISKCSCTRSASLAPISAIFWPRCTAWSSLTSRLWLWA